MTKPLTRHELWRPPDGSCDSFFAANNNSARQLLEPDSRLIFVVEAVSWDEAQQKRYEFMRWGIYRTVEELSEE